MAILECGACVVAKPAKRPECHNPDIIAIQRINIDCRRLAEDAKSVVMGKAFESQLRPLSLALSLEFCGILIGYRICLGNRHPTGDHPAGPIVLKSEPSGNVINESCAIRRWESDRMLDESIESQGRRWLLSLVRSLP
jgi:hypothetical protein